MVLTAEEGRTLGLRTVLTAGEEGRGGLRTPGRCSLLLLPQQGLSLLQPRLNFLDPLICILGSAVQLLLQEAQPHVGLTQLLSLDRGTLQLLNIIPRAAGLG